MDRRERINSRGPNALLVTLRAAFSGLQSGIWTALPAIVESYNAGAGTVEAQPTIQAQVRQPDGTWLDTTLPLCVDCPVLFQGGGGFLFSFPLKQGDEGVLFFASRCIDSWWQSGGIQTQAELRMHDLSDGFFFPTGGLSQPNIPGSLNTTTAQLRSKDGTTYIELTDGKIINIVAPDGINFTGPVTFNDEVTFLGHVNGNAGTVNFGAANLETTGDLTTGSVASVNAHKHSGVSTGAGDTGPPTG